MTRTVGRLFDCLPLRRWWGQSIVGYVERINFSEIRGWAFHRHGRALRLTLAVGRRRFGLSPNWGDRWDVAEAHGEAFLTSGYSCRVPEAASAALVQAARTGVSPRVLANGVALESHAELPDPPEPLSFDSVGVDTAGGALVLTEWGHFVIRGHYAGLDDPGRHLRLEVNGRIAEHMAMFVSPATEGSRAAGRAFQIELPGYLWQETPLADGLAVQLLLDAKPLLATPLRLTRQKAARWVKNIALSEEGLEQQYFALLALEHIRYGGLLPNLDAASRAFVQAFARRMRLSDYLGDHAELATAAPAMQAGEDQSAHWAALRQLNERLLAAGGGPVFAHVEATHKEYALSGDVARQFAESVIPLLSRTGELPALRRLVAFESFHRLEHVDYDTGLSLAIPILVADGLVQRAADALWRLAKPKWLVWLNTECLRYAATEVQRLERLGEVESDQAEAFRYAFIGVLDGFEGDWFSRLHDRELLLGMVSMLRDLAGYADYHRQDIVRAALRLYGLCPEFWELLAAERGEPVAEPMIRRAEAAWQRLAGLLRDDPSKLPGRDGEVAEALALFHRLGNPEALSCLREVIANCLPAWDREPPSAACALVDWLCAEDAMENVRIAAFPVPEGGRLVARQEDALPPLATTLRWHTTTEDHRASSVYALQQTAARRLLAARRAATTADRVALAAALDDLAASARALLNWQGMFLGCDLLASACALAHRGGFDTEPYLARWREAVLKAVRETGPWPSLTAPVAAGLRRMAGEARWSGQVAELLAQVGDLPGGGAVPSDSAAPVLGWPDDTLVVVYSCRKYLGSRIPAIRDTWVRSLRDRSIPYLILVGDGDDRVEGDILALQVSDKYEDLPRKTLALFGWVVRNTGYQYVLKIDDDCYLDVDRYFDSLAYRRHHYYGRVIRRDVGSMDRAWHQEKSHTFHARNALDKSPEPSAYADGGGGYTLSRSAMATLLAMAAGEPGQRLLACSMMEDKLVGDLLAMAGITPANEDYESYQRRRTFGAAVPVGMWENTFFPSAGTPTVMVHLDSEHDMAVAHRYCAGKELWPKKIWPGYRPLLLNAIWGVRGTIGSNQLEMLSSVDDAHTLLRAGLVVVSVVRNEALMLPHFLAHYRGLGVTCFIMVDNLSDDGTREYLLKQPDVVLFSADTEYRYSHYGVAWQQTVMGNLCLGKWVVLADADELLVFPGCERTPLPAFVAGLQQDGVDCVRTDMIDMYPSGDLADADFGTQTPFEAAPMFDRVPLRKWSMGSGWFSNCVNWTSSLRHRIDPDAEPNAYVAQKYALVRYQPWMRFSAGLHFMAGAARIAERPIWFAHFKYHAGFQRKVETEIRRGQHFDNAKEYRRYAAMLAESRGCFGDSELSLAYVDSGSFDRIEYQGEK